MLSRRQFFAAGLALVCCVVGCTKNEDRTGAERLLDHHFDALKRRTFDSALSDYHKAFFSDVSRSEWQSALTSVVDKLGTFRSYDINTFGMAFKKVAGPGKYLRLVCTVTYSKHVAQETFYVFRKEGSTRFKIVGHQIDSDALSK
ncbi:MAG TPA: hypothetical protein VFN67_00160 [Polyangiales bacterium]|jgi:hypothetical protein|nr:hypothetical protein [Polyangiales bacterium]